MKYNINTGIKNAKYKIQKTVLGIVALAFPITIALASGAASAAPPAFQLQPFEFVGTADQCAPAPAGTDTVTAKWDNTTGNPSPSIFLQKLGATENCAAAGVDIIGSVEGQTLSNLTELNFDYQNGGWCGAGAPRFNVQTDQGTAFLGCAGGVHTPTSDPNWTHVEFGPAELAAAYTAAGITNPTTATIQDIYIIFDEGQTESGLPLGSGTVNIDNISVNGQVVGSPTSPTNANDCKNGGWQNLLDKNGNTFKNQGQCVSYTQHTNGVGQDDTHAKSVR